VITGDIYKLVELLSCLSSNNQFLYYGQFSSSNALGIYSKGNGPQWTTTGHNGLQWTTTLTPNSNPNPLWSTAVHLGLLSSIVVSSYTECMVIKKHAKNYTILCSNSGSVRYSWTSN